MIACYYITDESIKKWYHTQRTRFSKLREGQMTSRVAHCSGAGLSSGEEEDAGVGFEYSVLDTDRDRFIHRVFRFLKPHIKRHKKDTPASVSTDINFGLM